MASYQGYVKHRRGILEHVEDGRLSVLDYAFHELLVQVADPSSGIARTSAAHLARQFRIHRKLAQKHLIRLERKGYIKRFRKPRSHATQIVLIHRFECVSSPHKGLILDAVNTTNWREPVYLTVSRMVSTENQEGYPQSPRSLLRLSLESKKDLKTKPARHPAGAETAPSGAQNPETEQRRRIHERALRLERETTVRRELGVGGSAQAEYPPVELPPQKQGEQYPQEPAAVSTAPTPEWLRKFTPDGLGGMICRCGAHVLASRAALRHHQCRPDSTKVPLDKDTGRT